MDKIKNIDPDQLKEIAADKGFGLDLMLKDYYVTIIHYLLKDIEGLYFKGGTALQKIFLDYSRLSEDVDYTLTRDVTQVRKEINSALEESGLFEGIKKDKDVSDFTRMVVPYKGFEGKEEVIFIDLNKRATLLRKPEKHEISHFYRDNIPQFRILTLAKEEMIAEKVAAAMGRNKPRDHYDIYKIIKAGMPIDIDDVKKKCESSGIEFNITRMFNKAKKLKARWDSSMIPLLAEEVSFKEVMATLSEHFNLRKGE